MWVVSVNARGKVLFCVTVQEESFLLDRSSCRVRDKQRFSVSKVAVKAISDYDLCLWGVVVCVYLGAICLSLFIN